MPKRIIDGDSLWVSEKLSTVPERYRVEYAWILPLAQANGCFECNPMLVWRSCYAALRTDWTTPDVAAMLDEFEAAKMLFRWKVDGKTFGFFVGAQKEGRLPKPSDRLKSAKQWQTGMLPEKELASFLGLTVKKVRDDYSELLATHSRVGRDKVADKSPTGNGVGDGSGAGVGSGEGDGSGYGVGNGTGDAAGAATPNTVSSNTPSNTSTHNNTQYSSPNTNTTPGEDELVEFLNPDSTLNTPRSVSDFVEILRLALRSNPNASAPPKGWEKMWREDFTTMLALVSPAELYDILVVSQIEKNQKFYVRTNSLVANLELLQRMVTEREKALPALRVEFRKKLASPISAEEERDELDDDDDDDFA
jgi:hypothetical protein